MQDDIDLQVKIREKQHSLQFAEVDHAYDDCLAFTDILSHFENLYIMYVPLEATTRTRVAFLFT